MDIRIRTICSGMRRISALISLLSPAAVVLGVLGEGGAEAPPEDDHEDVEAAEAEHPAPEPRHAPRYGLAKNNNQLTQICCFLSNLSERPGC